MSNFKGKTALVVGGTSGIGKATTLQLLEQGSYVHVIGRNPDKLDNFDGLVKHRVDITLRQDVQKLTETIEQMERIDFLVNASGIFGPKPFLDHTSEDYDSYLDLNRGFFFISQAVAKKMKALGGGSIVNVGSMWARQAVKATPSSRIFHAESRATLLNAAHGDGIG